MKLNSLQDLLTFEIHDLLSAEKQMLQVYPKIVQSIAHKELKEILEKNQRQTVIQEQRLEQCLQKMNLPVHPGRSHGMIGIISSWMELQGSEAQPDVRDAASIALVQQMAHYQIAGYGCAHAFAESTELPEVAGLLRQTLLEEEEFDRALTEIAENVVNQEAELHTR